MLVDPGVQGGVGGLLVLVHVGHCCSWASWFSTWEKASTDSCMSSAVELSSGVWLMPARSEEHTSEPSHSQISYAVFCLKKKNTSEHRRPLRSRWRVGMSVC